MDFQYGLYPYQAGQIPDGYCNAPGDFKAELTGDIVTLSWVPAHEVLYYNLTIRKLPDNTVVFSGQIHGSRYITQLDPNSDFRAFLETVCSDDPLRKADQVITADFSTGDHVVQCLPVNISAVLFAALPESVLLTWPAAAEAVAYTVFYKVKESMLPFEKVSVQTNKIELKALVPKTDYSFYIVTMCKDGSQATSETGTFQTPCDVEECPPPKINAIVNGKSAVVVWEYTGLHTAFDVYINGALYLANYPSNIINLNDLVPSEEYVVTVSGRCDSCSSVAGSFKFTAAADPCAKPLNLRTQVVGDIVTVLWDAVADQAYKVVINGSSTEGVLTQQTFRRVAGVKYTIQVATVCAAGNSAFAELILEPDATTCAIIPAEDITVTPTALTIKLDWPDQPGARLYRVKSRQLPDGVFALAGETTNSEYTVEAFTPLTDYEFEIEVECVNGSTSTTQKQGTTLDLCPGIKPVIVGIDNVTTGGATFRYVAGTVVRGNFVIKVTNIATGVVDTYTSETLSVDVTDCEPHTDYSVVVELHDPECNVMPSNAFQFTTCYQCKAVTNLAATFAVNGDTIITWNGAPGASEYKVWARRMNSTTRELLATTVDLTYTIPAGDLGTLLQEVTVQSVYQDCGNACEASVVTACPQAVDLVSEVEGTIVNLSWKPVFGAYGYNVTATSLTAEPIEVFTPDASLHLEDLTDKTTYSWNVEVVCLPNVKGAVSATKVFTTGDLAPVDTGCAEPDVAAISQASSLADPTDSGSGNVDNSAAAIINYFTFIHDDFDRSLTFKNADGTARDITGYTFKMKIISDGGITVLEATLNDYLTNGGANGVLYMLIPASELEALGSGSYAHEIYWTNTQNVTKMIIKGSFTIKPDGYDQPLP